MRIVNRFRFVVTAGVICGSISLQGASYKVDPAASTLTWEGGKKLVASKHNGTLKVASGSVEFDKKDLIPVSAKIVVDMTSITNLDLAKDPESKGKLEGHLKSDDFFNVSKFPTASFDLKAFKADKGQGNYLAEGLLTIRGKTEAISGVKVELQKKGAQATASGGFVFDRAKWGIVYNTEKFFSVDKLKEFADRVIKNEIDVGFNLVANK